MQIKKGSIAFIYHSTSISPFKSLVLDVSETELVLRLTKDFPIYSYFEGDIINVNIEHGTEVYSVNSKIAKIDMSIEFVACEIINTNFITNKRMFERYPVSYYATVQKQNFEQKNVAIAKNISLEGLMFQSKNRFSVGDEVMINILIHEIFIPLNVKVMREVPHANCFEYGTKILDDDVNTQQYIEQCVFALKSEQDEYSDRLSIASA